MSEIVTVKEIQEIKERLEQEKKAKHILPGRYDELDLSEKKEKVFDCFSGLSVT